jgi:hypothetical protein
VLKVLRNSRHPSLFSLFISNTGRSILRLSRHPTRRIVLHRFSFTFNIDLIGL